jgi:hypothetical protein
MRRRARFFLSGEGWFHTSRRILFKNAVWRGSPCEFCGRGSKLVLATRRRAGRKPAPATQTPGREPIARVLSVIRAKRGGTIDVDYRKNADNRIPEPRKFLVHEISLYPWPNLTRGFCGYVTSGRAAALFSSDYHIGAAGRVCFTQYRSGIGIATGRRVDSHLAAPLCRFLWFRPGTFMSSRADRVSSSRGKRGNSCELTGGRLVRLARTL